jgi:hypothetical protein
VATIGPAITDVVWGGAWPGSADGYDGQPLASLYGTQGVGVLLYRQNGPEWAGPTGFYSQDYESPIPPGGSKRWWNIYLWCQNYSAPADRVEFLIGPEGPGPVPGYTARLVLDYVPPVCNWTGPTSFDLDMTRSYGLTLPVATVQDPLQGTRMHLTVYAPIPEPASLVALAGGLAVLGLRGRRRRARK